MNVRDVMSPLELTLSPDTPVTDAARLLLDRHLPGLPVIDSAGKLQGMVTRRDVVAKHAHVHVPVFIGFLGSVAPFRVRGSRDEIERALAVRVSDLMDTDLTTVDAKDSVDDAASLMTDKDLDPIPVLDNGRLVGTISMEDVIRLVIVEEEDAGEQS